MKATTLIGIIPHYKNLFFSRLKPKKRTKKRPKSILATKISNRMMNLKKKIKKNPIPVKIVSV